jgi:hypothetical protein
MGSCSFHLHLTVPRRASLRRKKKTGSQVKGGFKKPDFHNIVLKMTQNVQVLSTFPGSKNQEGFKLK